jgi:hypothetical protein
MPKKPSKSKQFLALSTLAGSLLLTSGAGKLKSLEEKPPELRLPYGLVSSKELRELLKKWLKDTTPSSPRVLTEDEQEQLSQLVYKTLGVRAVSQLNGNSLNHQIGYMGLEQHLKRYPEDTLAGRSFPQAGLAPGKGAWGYFTSSHSRLTTEDINKEKYYLAVQTLYLPDWKVRLGELRDWYKHRKMLVINPDTGQAVVAVIADAGPAKWTGKQFGGSPQVMHDLGFYPKATKGKVVLLFLDDPENEVPLGPIVRSASQPTSSI